MGIFRSVKNMMFFTQPFTETDSRAVRKIPPLIRTPCTRLIDMHDKDRCENLT
jgi:hypothetical protein